MADPPAPTSVGSNGTVAAVAILGPATSSDARVNLKLDPSRGFVSRACSDGTTGG